MASDVSDDSEFEDAMQDNEDTPPRPQRHAAEQQEQHQSIQNRQEGHNDANDVDEAEPLPVLPPQQQEEDPGVGINAHEIVRQVIDNLWPVVREARVAAAEDEDDDGMENVEDGYFDEEVDGEPLNESDNSPEPLNENNDESPFPEFDLQLPTRHSYLGEGMEELQGRIVFDDGGPTPEIPLIVMGIQLVPGQTLPLTIFHAVFQNAIRRCVLTNKVFGIVHNDMDMPLGSNVYKGAFGTIAEIYEFQEEVEPTGGEINGTGTFALKAKGRQRFNVVNFRRQADGNLIGMVKVRPEIRLAPFVRPAILNQTHRYRFPIKRRQTEDIDIPTTRKLQKTFSISNNTSKDDDCEDSAVVDADLAKMREKIMERRKVTKFYSAFTPFPYFVYEQFEEPVLVEKVHRKLRVELKGLTESGNIIPKDATALSFWLAQNLTMDDEHRIKILKMDSAVQRLRYELDLLARACKKITCRLCETTIAESREIFSMSMEGPQGTYVNPHGFVHETLTVHKASKDVVLRGASSTEASWFPGYSWTIAECRRCRSHLGWKFRAVDRLKPPKFWGLARRSISFKYEILSEEEAAKNETNSNGADQNQRSRSTSSQTFSTNHFII